MKWPRLLLIATAWALAGLIWLAWHPTPERQIRKQLEGAARAASFGPKQGAFAKLAGASAFADFFSTNVEINVDVPGRQEHRLIGQLEIQQAALALRGSMQSLSVAVPEMTLIVNPDKVSAIADLTLQVRIAGEPDMAVQEVKVTLRKIKGDWLIVKAETVKTLQ